MDFFEEATLRLKQELKVKTDKEVADILGLTQRAWVGRKKRGNFPELEVQALKTQRPELGLDIDYIFTGIRAAQYDADIAKAAQNPLTNDAERIAGMYAMLAPQSQAMVMEMVSKLRLLEVLLKQGDKK